MPTAPISAARFAITVDGVQIASFSELAGVKTGVASVDFVESGSDETVLLNRFTNARIQTAIKLVRPRNLDARLILWHRAGSIDRVGSLKNCSVTLYGSHDQPVAKYYLESAWPSEIEMGLKSSGRKIEQMETVTMTCEFIQRISI